jgi:hypothetical protein
MQSKREDEKIAGLKLNGAAVAVGNKDYGELISKGYD